MEDDILTKLNKNYEAGGGFSQYENEELEVVKVGVVYASDLGITVSKEYEMNPWFTIVLKRSTGEQFVVQQMLFFGKDEKGNLSKTKINSPYSPSYPKKTGQYGPASLVYSIGKAIEMNNEGVDFRGKNVWGAKLWAGKKFWMGLKVGTIKATGKPFYILETDEQKYYDFLSREHHAATNEWVTDKGILRDMDHGQYPPKDGGRIDINSLPDNLGGPSKTEESLQGMDLSQPASKSVPQNPNPKKAVNEPVNPGDDLPF